MKKHLMATLVFGSKTKMREQKAFWMHMKMFSIFAMNKLNLGSGIAFEVKDAEAKASAEAVAEEKSSIMSQEEGRLSGRGWLCSCVLGSGVCDS